MTKKADIPMVVRFRLKRYPNCHNSYCVLERTGKKWKNVFQTSNYNNAMDKLLELWSELLDMEI